MALGRYYRWLARSMRIQIILMLVVLALISFINWRSGDDNPPLWFYAAVIAFLGLVWLITKLFLAISDRRK